MYLRRSKADDAIVVVMDFPQLGRRPQEQQQYHLCVTSPWSSLEWQCKQNLKIHLGHWVNSMSEVER